MSNLVRSLVSKKKRRFHEDGFDLDLTYITKNIVAMGFPAEKVEGMYRNKMSDVVKFLDIRHLDHYKVYNLCAERTYDKSKFHGRVAHYPFDDHNAPPLELMKPFCEDVHQWLAADEKNVAAIHCKAGKGRTGVMICAYMLHCGMWETAEQSLAFYGAARTENKKGVTIPSQARYVKYYEQMLKSGMVYQPVTVLLNSVTLHTIPHFGKEGICNPSFTLKMKNVKVYSGKPMEMLTRTQPFIRSQLSRPVPLCGDVKVEFAHKQPLKKEKMFHFWFNTAFIDRQTGLLILTKQGLDKAHKDKHDKLFDPQFKIEFQFTIFGESAAAITSPQLQHTKLPESTRSSLAGGDEEDEDDEEDSFAYDVGDEEEEDEEDGDEQQRQQQQPIS